MPVLETLGGALFGAVLQVLFQKLDSHQVLDYFRGRKLDEKLLKKLKRKLMDINAVIDDAELKQFSNSLVKEWLDEVRDVLYDAEDLLEQIDYEYSKSELKAEFQSSASKVSSFESKMIEMLDDVESLLNQKVVQDFRISSGVGSGLGNKVSEKRTESTSLVAEEVIYGRDEDKEKILNWLTSDSNNDKQLSIFAIVAMGGTGKTTLAQHVYNDPKVKEAQFNEKAWVCVSDEFDVFKLTTAILEEIQKKTDDSRNLNTIQGRLKEKLTGRKFLLVLDDVWNEDRNQWKSLQTPLRYGGKGSKILVTTGSNKVASTMESNNIHQLTQLNKDDSWQVFAKHAFQDENSKSNSELKEIGTKIVEKCKGLPLALETVGGLLRSKSSVSEWEGVLRSNIWDLSIEDSKIIPALLLSYYHLPSHLKRCFAYCALFPKDYLFRKNRLISLWMAENFLQCSPQSKSPEEVGEQYFNDLLSRSFFQQLIKQGIEDTGTRFVMHDLHNDLAKYVSGEMCFRLGVDRAERVPKTTRHFSTEKNPLQYDEYSSLCDAERLRTFLSIYINRGTSLEELISTFKFLRSLSLNSCHNIKEVPDTIGDLIHLRSLDLSSKYIERLPDSMCSLYNLQELRLNNCFNLKELPSSLHELTKLRRLELKGTSLRKAPVLLGKLKNLQVWLSTYEVGKSSEFSIQQLDLHGELSIENLENIVNPCDALAADLKNKTNLVALDFKWDLKRNNEDSIKEREVLENLQPSRHLERLTINGYGGTQFPRWLSDNCLCNVVSLTLEHCKYCLWLPSLGLLTSLKYLKIKGLDEIVRIDADFYGNTSSAFPSLETLYISDMKAWEEWQCMTGAFPNLESLSVRNCPKLKMHLPEHLPHLYYLYISQCKQLVASVPRAVEIEGVNMESYSFELLSINCCPGINIPINHCYLPNVVSLTLEHCKYCLWLPSLGLLTSLKYLKIKGLDEIVRIDADFYGNTSSSFPSLETLSFTDMTEWAEWQCMTGAFPRLQSLWVMNCPKLKGHLPEQLPHLKNLTIYNCEQLGASTPRAVEIEGVKMETSSFDMTGHLVSDPPLEFLHINSCPGMNIPINHCYHFLKTLNISECCDSLTNFHLDLFPKLCDLSLDKCRNLQMISQGHPHCHLKSLTIHKCSLFESFPNEGLFAPQLKIFEITGMEKLKSMPKHMSALLQSLNRLRIEDCPGVELSDGCLPTNIEHMDLLNCSKLVSSLKGALEPNASLQILSISGVDVESFPDEGLLPLSLIYLRIHDCPNLKKLEYRGLCHLSSLREIILEKCPVLQCLPEEGLLESFSRLEIRECPLLTQR